MLWFGEVKFGVGIWVFLFDKCKQLTQNEFVRRNIKGFTLIELILVMALVGILAVVGLGSYMQATVKAKDTRRKNDLNQYAKALEMFINDVGRYPQVDASGKILCPNFANGSMVQTDCLGILYAFIGDSNPVAGSKKYEKTVYMDDIPTDPEAAKSYIYVPSAGQNDYALYAALDNLEDRDVVTDEGVVTDWSVSCGSAMCNYKVTSLGLIREK